MVAILKTASFIQPTFAGIVGNAALPAARAPQYAGRVERRKLKLLRHPQFQAMKDAMLGFLFRGLTAEPARGAALFDALTAEARRHGWYVAAEVPDTLDGRFAVVATVTAITIVRLEREGEPGGPRRSR